MKTFNVGTIRENGDEVRSLDLDNTRQRYLDMLSSKGIKPGANMMEWFAGQDWRQTELVGHAIMASDLMHLEFRRIT
jgi:hypothetical protein